jgi:hypothetical protein
MFACKTCNATWEKIPSEAVELYRRNGTTCYQFLESREIHFIHLIYKSRKPVPIPTEVDDASSDAQ